MNARNISAEFEALLSTIARVTAFDLKHKTVGELFASAVEELGEVARAMLVEQDTFGHRHKKLDEPLKSECVDLFLCALSLYFAHGGVTASLKSSLAVKLDYDWFLQVTEQSVASELKQRGIFGMLGKALSELNYTNVTPEYREGEPLCDRYRKKKIRLFMCGQFIRASLRLFFAAGGNLDELFEIANAKAGKWMRSQTTAG